MSTSHRHTRAPFPISVARDLLGITRALFRAELAGAGDTVRLGKLRSVGERLKLALRLASTTEPGTLGHSAAWSHAEDAVQALGELVSDDALTVRATVEATAARVRRR